MYEHKIILRVHAQKSRVSCECRAVLGKHSRNRGGGEYYEPMDWPVGETAFEVYNKPENHWAPFTEQDRIKT